MKRAQGILILKKFVPVFLYKNTLDPSVVFNQRNHIAIKGNSIVIYTKNLVPCLFCSREVGTPCDNWPHGLETASVVPTMMGSVLQRAAGASPVKTAQCMV